MAAPAQVDLVILKVVQNCNLNCTYCYVYNRGDLSWRDRPQTISHTVVRQLAKRISEHCGRYGLSKFTVELHGGEPLLLGKPGMQSLIDTLRAGCGEVELGVILQTNGTLLDREWLELFERNTVCFGISLDGPPEIADRRRIRLNGRGSTRQVIERISRLRTETPLFEALFGGCLCVVDPSCDGAAMVDWFMSQGIDRFDFLLPDGNYVNRPQEWSGVEPYRRFLLEAFERWFSLGERAPHIRKFELMMMGLLGERAPLDALGGDLRRLCVVESDGSIGVNDVARICGGEYSKDVLNIFDHTLDEHVTRYRIDEIQEPSDHCKACPQFLGCRGGYLPHRFDGASFANPSIYCDALYAVSERMTEILREHLPSRVWVDADSEEPAHVVG